MAKLYTIILKVATNKCETKNKSAKWFKLVDPWNNILFVSASHYLSWDSNTASLG